MCLCPHVCPVCERRLQLRPPACALHTPSKPVTFLAFLAFLSSVISASASRTMLGRPLSASPRGFNSCRVVGKGKRPQSATPILNYGSRSAGVLRSRRPCQ